MIIIIMKIVVIVNDLCGHLGLKVLLITASNFGDFGSHPIATFSGIEG